MSLSLTNSQTNDAKLLYLTDNSTWNDTDLPTWDSITNAILSIQYKTPDLDDFTTAVEIDVISIFNAASSSSDLIFPLEFGSEPSLYSDSIGINVFPDGIWKIQYTVGDEVDTWSFDSALDLLLEQNIKNEIYSQLSQVNTKYICANNYYTKPIDDILLLYTEYVGMLANAYVAKQSEVLNILETMQRQTE